MATSGSALPPLSSFSTALVLLPPTRIQSLINPLRSANDKSFPRWTSHLTLVFPFVEPHALPTACALIRDALVKSEFQPFSFKLDKVDKFKQGDYDTVYLGPSQSGDVHRLWDLVSSAVGYSGRPFVPHLTLGQTHSKNNPPAVLQGKAELLLEQVVEWDVCSVVVLRKSDAEGGVMKIHEEIFLSPDTPSSPGATITALLPATYRFEPASEIWIPCLPIPSESKTATVATYNVLHDSRFPAKARINGLLSALLLVQPIPDVVCLQEVTDESFQLLLSDHGIRSRWPLCTHDPTSVLPNERNIVFLAREAFSFTWEQVQLRKHKPAAILRFSLHGVESLIVSGVHLTAGLRASHHRSKLDELNVLIRFLQQRYSSSPWVVLGDFNIPTSHAIPLSIMDHFNDAWLTAHSSEDGGATYDPTSNVLAAETVKDGRSPQRYDRVWVRHDAGIQVDLVEKFGLGSGASDHYGLTASLSLGIDPAYNPVMEVQTKPNHMPDSDPMSGDMEGVEGMVGKVHGDTHGVTAFQMIVSDKELDLAVRQGGGFPTTDQQDERARVAATLRAVLSLKSSSRSSVQVGSQPPEPSSISIRPQSAVRFEFVPVGSFGLGVDTQDSDVDVLVIGNIPPRTFWSLARALFQKSAPKSHNDDAGISENPSPVIVKRFVKDASVPMMELVVGNVRVDMQYCSASKLLESWDQIGTLPPTDPVFLLPASSLRTLNAYRTLLAVLRIVPTASLPTFRLAHRALKLFCVSQGIYFSRLGYLGGIHITLLLARIIIISPPNRSAMELIHTFFATYADWDWERKAATIPGVNDTSTYARAVGREPMVIMSIEKPMLNVVQNANRHTRDAIASTFKKAHQQLTAGLRWTDVCGSGGTCGNVFESTFLSSYESYIKLDLLLWGSSAPKARAWISYIESRLPQLLAHLQTSLPNWTVRLWPSRLVDANNSGHLATGLQSFYLLGLDAREPTSMMKVEATLLSFENQLQRNETFYDPTEMFISVSKVQPSQLPTNITTPPPWLDGGIDPNEDTSDEDEVTELSEDRDSDAAFAPISSKQGKKCRPQKLKGRNTPHIPAPKLRTSSDVYYRILWDRELNAEDYFIGYEDRFSGLEEMPLTNWKRDIEDEDFVPFHRIMHFRRKADGVLIWDRRNKIDLMFGSGIQQKPS